MCFGLLPKSNQPSYNGTWCDQAKSRIKLQIPGFLFDYCVIGTKSNLQDPSTNGVIVPQPLKLSLGFPQSWASYHTCSERGESELSADKIFFIIISYKQLFSSIFLSCSALDQIHSIFWSATIAIFHNTQGYYTSIVEGYQRFVLPPIALQLIKKPGLQGLFLLFA